MTACTFFEVSPPSRTPSEDGLLVTLERASLTVETDPPGRWIGGVQFRPEACGGGGIWVDNCLFNAESPDSPGEEGCDLKVFNTFHDAVPWHSMLIFSSVHCSTFSDQPDVNTQAKQQFNLSRDAIAAFELYYGQANRLMVAGETCDDSDPVPQNPFIADALTNSFPTAATPGDWTSAVTLDPVAGMALILDQIATITSGATAVLHIPPGLAAVWLALELIEKEDGLYRTSVGGHLVIAAPGYYGSTPLDDTDPGNFDGHSPGFVAEGGWWVYVTGGMGLYQDAVRTEDTLEHRRNNYFTVAEQFVLPFFDPTCPRFALPVGRDCSSLEIDWSDPLAFTPVEQIFNDQFITCVDPDGGNEGTPMDPAIFVGVEYPAPS